MIIYFQNNTFLANSEYSEKDILKGNGFWWNPELKKWYTKKTDIAERLIEKCDDSAKYAIIRLKEENKKQEEEKTIKKEESFKTISNIDIPSPKNLSYLPYQKAGIDYISKNKNSLIADEMGLGKTIQTIGLINLDKNLNKILIIVPASLKINWNNELNKWLTRDLTISIANGNFDINSNILIINYDLLKKYSEEILKFEYDLLILDESHFVKNYKAQRTKNVIELSKKCKKRILLTGTPILNKPSELFTQLQILENEMVKSWKYFMKRYANAKETRYGWDISGASNLDELNNNLRSTCMIRRLKKDVLTELPEKRRQLIEIEAEGNLKKLINEEKEIYEKNMFLQEKMKELKKLNKKESNEKINNLYIESIKNLKEETIDFSEISKIRHQVALEKVDPSVEIIKEFLENQDKIIVFAHHIDVIENIVNNLKEFCIVSKITGTDSIEERQKNIEEFQNGKTNVIICSIKAAGIGITLTSSSTVIFVEESWTPADISQAEDRAHRIGQKNAVNIYHIIINDSIDAHLAKVNIEKQEIIEKAIN